MEGGGGVAVPRGRLDAQGPEPGSCRPSPLGAGGRGAGTNGRGRLQHEGSRCPAGKDASRARTALWKELMISGASPFPLRKRPGRETSPVHTGRNKGASTGCTSSETRRFPVPARPSRTVGVWARHLYMGPLTQRGPQRGAGAATGTGSARQDWRQQRAPGSRARACPGEGGRAGNALRLGTGACGAGSWEWARLLLSGQN